MDGTREGPISIRRLSGVGVLSGVLLLSCELGFSATAFAEKQDAVCAADR